MFIRMILGIYGLQQVMMTNIVIEQQTPYCTLQESLSVFCSCHIPGLKNRQNGVHHTMTDYVGIPPPGFWILSVGDTAKLRITSMRLQLFHQRQMTEE